MAKITKTHSCFFIENFVLAKKHSFEREDTAGCCINLIKTDVYVCVYVSLYVSVCVAPVD